MAPNAPEQPQVSSQEGALVGDENLTEVRTVEPVVVSGTVPAQVAPPRESDASEVPVHETSVQLDEVITDPSDPRAVQVPDAGRGSLDLPIHRLAEPSPEQVFADSSEEDDADEDAQTEPADEENEDTNQDD